MDDILRNLKSKGFTYFEGYTQECKDQVKDLQEIIIRNKVESVFEIGFNAGHSSQLFLKCNQKLKVTSVDIGIHKYVLQAKSYIDRLYPHRHSLIIGDSTTEVPLYISENRNKTFDCIFIDGCHTDPTPFVDLRNCMNLAHNDTIVIMDDTMYKSEWIKEYTCGPTKAWKSFVEDGKIKELKTFDYGVGRGMSVGKYVFDL